MTSSEREIEQDRQDAILARERRRSEGGRQVDQMLRDQHARNAARLGGPARDVVETIRSGSAAESAPAWTHVPDADEIERQNRESRPALLSFGDRLRAEYRGDPVPPPREPGGAPPLYSWLSGPDAGTELANHAHRCARQDCASVAGHVAVKIATRERLSLCDEHAQALR